jgi:hypothetical protein
MYTYMTYFNPLSPLANFFHQICLNLQGMSITKEFHFLIFLNVKIAIETFQDFFKVRTFFTFNDSLL